MLYGPPVPVPVDRLAAQAAKRDVVPCAMLRENCLPPLLRHMPTRCPNNHSTVLSFVR